MRPGRAGYVASFPSRLQNDTFSAAERSSAFLEAVTYQLAVADRCLSRHPSLIYELHFLAAHAYSRPPPPPPCRRRSEFHAAKEPAAVLPSASSSRRRYRMRKAEFQAAAPPSRSRQPNEATFFQPLPPPQIY